MHRSSLVTRIMLCAAATVGGFAQSGPSTGFAEHEPRYRIQPSDILEIHYRYSQEFDQTVTVQPDGFVVLEIAGDVKVQGLTLELAKAAILEKASQRLQNPEITVVLKDFEKPYFFVGGQVGNPGRFEMRGTIDPLQAIAMAGGFKDASAKHSQVILFRKVGPDLAKTEILNLGAAMNGTAREKLPNLQAGDTLVVPQNQISKIERYIKLVNIGTYIPF